MKTQNEKLPQTGKKVVAGQKEPDATAEKAKKELLKDSGEEKYEGSLRSKKGKNDQ